MLVLVMLVVILLYDQLLFRPLLAWSRKFRGDPAADEDDVRPWFLIVMQRARLFDLLQSGVLAINRGIDHVLAALVRHWAPEREAGPRSPLVVRLFDLALLAMAAAALAWLIAFVRETCCRRDRLGRRARRRHRAAGAGADRPRLADLGADRRMDRAAPAGRRPRQRSCSFLRPSRPICSSPRRSC